MIELNYNGARMLIAERGAEARAYRDAQGTDRLWSGDPAVWSGVSPMLFPSIGFLKDGKATIEGRECAIPKHGFARDMDFSVCARGEDYVSLALEASDATKRVYPFDFQLTVTHKLINGGFETRFSVVNRDTRVMPFVIGGHPAFACPADGEGSLEDYELRFEQPEKPETLLCSPAHLIDGSEPAEMLNGRALKLRYADFDRLDTYVFAGVKSRAVELINPAAGKGCKVSFWGMEVLAVWTKPGACAPYLCIEPWQGLPALADESGRFEDKPYHVELAPQGEYECGYRMEIVG